MADLKAKAPGTVFFGTASFLLLEESAQDLLWELPQKMELNPAAPCAWLRQGWIWKLPVNILTHMNQDGIWHGCARPRRPGSRLRFLAWW